MVTTGESTPQYLSLRRCSRTLGVGRHRLRQAVDRGELRACRPGGRTIFVRLSDAHRWLSHHVVRPSDHARARVEEVLQREEHSTGDMS